MSKLTVDLNNKESMLLATAVISMLLGTTSNPAPLSVPDDNGLDDGLGDMGLGLGAGDGLDDLLGGAAEPEVPAFPTIDDMKVGLQGLIQAKGKDVALALVKKAFAKMGVNKMDEIADEKREMFIKYLAASAKA